MSPNSSIRERARYALGNNIFSGQWIFALLAYLVISFISGFLSSFIFGVIFTGLLYISLKGYFLAICRGTARHDDLGILYNCVKDDIGGGIVLGILQGLFIFLWSMLFMIPGIVKSYSYSLAYYIKLDHPEISATQAITESRRMMDGFKFKKFCLDFSFIGWVVLSIFTCGIGMLWISPYMEAANAAFYDDVRMVKGDSFAAYGGINEMF
jgi:uncharacterized membrane protein